MILVSTIINGLATGMAVFIVATGLTLVLGVLKVLNFAHGAFFMIGAYIAFTLLGDDSATLSRLIGASLVSGVAVGVLGLLTDRVIFRRLRDVDPHFMLIATFALLMVCAGVTKLIWGVDFHSVLPPEILAGMTAFGPVALPTYSLFVILVGASLFVLLEFVFAQLWIGKVVKTVALDPWMAQLCGVRVARVFSGAVVFSFFLAGFAGAVLLPNQSLSPSLADTYLLQGFIVVIIGGFGNIRGAFIASVLLGLIDSINTLALPTYPGIAVYFAMIASLLWRPEGLLNRVRA